MTFWCHLLAATVATTALALSGATLQSARKPTKTGDAAIIELIRSRFSQIKSATGFRERAREYRSERNPRRGKVVASYDGDELRQLTDKHTIGDHCGARDEYYFWDDAVFFVFKWQSCWELDTASIDPETGGPKTRDELVEDRLYFDGERLIQHLYREGNDANSLKRRPNKKMIADPTYGANVLAEAKRLLTFLRSSKPHDGLVAPAN